MSTRVYATNKFERPFSPNHAMHLTLRTKIRKLRSRYILGWLRKFIPEKAKYFGVTLFHFAIIDNHLHLLIQTKEKDALSGFLRVLSGVIARKVLGIEKGKKATTRMWEERPYSRVITWGREFKNVLHYIERNVLEAARKISYTLRNSPLSVEVRQEIERSLLLGKVSNSRQLVLRI